MDQCTNQTECNTGNEVSEDLSEHEAVKQVFSIDLTSEKIFNFLIFDKDFNIDHKMVQTLRLVQKDWLKTTSTLLQRSLLPTIVMKADITGIPRQSVNGLNGFITTLTSKRLPYSLLPFKLSFTSDYFDKENLKDLLKCLTLLGKELLELSLYLPMDEESVPLVIPQFVFPLLRKISFTFTERTSSVKTEKEILLLQQILNGSETLQELVLPPTSEHKLPTQIESLQIPNSVWSVQIHNKLNTELMEVFLKNQLSNLKHLTLSVPTTPSESDMVFKILERFQCSLTSFKVDGKHIHPTPRMMLKLPKLEKLEKIEMSSMAYDLELENSSNLQELLPNVKHFSLLDQSEANLAKWIQSSKFDLVETLNLSIVEDRVVFNSVSLEMMAQVHTTFPNVTTLEITVNNKDMTGLLYLFQEMVQLKSLKIQLLLCSLVKHHLHYESVLIGLPWWLTFAHEEESEFFQSYIRKRGRKPSLINLSELTSFTLCVDETSTPSDLLFKLTYLRMPKLRTITLSKNIQPTEEMEEKWKAQGRVIKYVVNSIISDY